MALNGHGLTAIMKAMNAEKLSLGRSGHFSRPTVRMVLASRAVIGECQPKTEVNGIRETAGEPIKGFYPAIVSEKDFYAVKAGFESRKLLLNANPLNSHWLNCFTRRIVPRLNRSASANHLAFSGTVPHSGQRSGVARRS
jgi:hypothetical protein